MSSHYEERRRRDDVTSTVARDLPPPLGSASVVFEDFSYAHVGNQSRATVEFISSRPSGTPHNDSFKPLCALRCHDGASDV